MLCRAVEGKGKGKGKQGVTCKGWGGGLKACLLTLMISFFGGLHNWAELSRFDEQGGGGG